MTRDILVLAVLINALMLLVLAEVVFVVNQTEAPRDPIPAAPEALSVEAPGLKAREVRP